VSDSVILRYNAQTLEKIDEYSTVGLFIDESIKYKGQIYFIIDYFLHIIKNGVLIELTDIDIPVEEFAFGIAVDSNTVILGTNNNLAFTFDGSGYKTLELKSPFFKNNVVTNGYFYTDSTIIVSSLAGGIAIIDFKKQKIVRQISFFNGLPDDEIRATFIDKQKGVWLSHEFGISRVDFTQGIESYSYYPGLKGNPIALKYFDNLLYVATNDGLFVLDQVKDYKEFEVKINVPTNVTVEVPVASVVVPDASEQESDNEKKGLWFFKSKKKKSTSTIQPTASKPVVQTTTQNKIVNTTKTIKKRSLNSISHYFKLVDGMSGKYSQLVVLDNYLLVAGNNGLFAVKGKKSQAILKNKYIVDIYISNDIAYCSTNNGLYKIFREGNKWQINHFAETTSTVISSVSQENDGNWIIAYDNVLIRAELKYKEIHIIHEVDLEEIPGQTFIVKTINDSTYVFTSNKLFHFTKEGELKTLMEFDIDNYLVHNQQDLTWLFNNKEWKLYSNQHKTLSSYIKRINLFGAIRYIDLGTDSCLWIIDDRNHLIKLNEINEKYTPDFKVQLIKLSSGENNLNYNEKIKLLPYNNMLVSTFSAPFYMLDKGVQFSYTIEGQSKYWSPWYSTSQINLGTVSAGEYTLKYRARNIPGDIVEGTPIKIIVPKPFTHTFWFFLLLVIIFAAGAYVVFKIRLQKLEKDKQILEKKVKERTATIEKQKGKIEKQHDEITQSIRYAKRIQTAMLPHDEIIEAMLPNHFILFNPRDIVSGDFYFFKILGNKLAFVAADCTGHGVPGGFMSMLGISYLTEITSQRPTPNAAKIIDHLRDKIKLTLGQTDLDSTQKDGMDLSICLIDTDKKQIEFAGAFNPLYMIRNGELEIVKADRQPVAVYFKEATFTNHVIDVQPGDVFYMFSDGYPDQIGGPKQRKFMTKNFKALLLENYKLEMKEQKQILQQAINDWKGDSMQVDDILVVGFKL